MELVPGRQPSVVHSEHLNGLSISKNFNEQKILHVLFKQIEMTHAVIQYSLAAFLRVPVRSDNKKFLFNCQLQIYT